MITKKFVPLVIACLLAAIPVYALERGTPGPLGFSDIRSASLPPPGLYSGLTYSYVRNKGLNDGKGNRVRFLDSLKSSTHTGSLSFIYVPDLDMFDGRVGLTTILSGGSTCGRVLPGDVRCLEGLRDPYVELAWSKFSGKYRPSEHPGALPIAEGLAIRLGLGVVVPVGRYEASAAQSHGLTLGNNIWDFAPHVGFTYTTPPIFSEGTEFSGKLSFNEYLNNSATDYSTGDLVNLDFAVSERLGRSQLGVGGNFFKQIEDDKQFGMRVGTDGRRGTALNLGLVGAYDLPEFGSSIRIRGVTSVINNNLPNATSISVTLVRKLY